MTKENLRDPNAPRIIQHSNNDEIVIPVPKPTIAYGEYLGGFVGAVFAKDLVENELRVAMDQERSPSISIRDFFRGSTWKTVGEEMSQTGSWKEVGLHLTKDFGIQFAAMLPGALLGYLGIKALLEKESVADVHVYIPKQAVQPPAPAMATAHPAPNTAPPAEVDHVQHEGWVRRHHEKGHAHGV